MTGYLCLITAQFVCIAIAARRNGWSAADAAGVFTKIRRRLRKPMPLLFAIICAISLVGGALNPVTNGDSISYRIPRVLHWLSERHWFWIHTADDRMNGVGCNFEWLSGQFIALGHDRFSFLVSLGAYMLLPGLFFSFLRLAGVSGKVAWWWSWVLPAGWIFAMQASSFSTDAFAATPALAALVFGLRGVKLRWVEDLWFSILAAGVLTGTKQTTLPLLLVWIVPMLQGLPLLLRRLPATLMVTVVALAASALPITLANIHYLGNWKGLIPGVSSREITNPFWGCVGNACAVIAQNFQPPIFPQAPAWNRAMEHFVKTPLGSHFSEFENFARLGRAPSELNSGMGLFISTLLLGSVIGAVRARNAKAPNLTVRMLRWFPFISAAVFMSKSGLSEPGRYLTPYYPFFFPALLSARGHLQLVATRWWRCCAFACVAITIGLLLMSRQRPLFPADLVTTKLTQRFPNSGWVKKIRNAYSFTTQQRELKEKIDAAFPANELRVGYAANKGMMEPIVWRSAPGRKVYRFNPDDDISRARELGIRYIFVDSTLFWGPVDRDIQTWLKRFPGQIVAEIPLRALPEAPPDISYVIKLDPPK